MSRDSYESPLEKRYASKEMQHIFSDNVKFSTWRKLWVILAEAEKELGLDITDEQIEEMKSHIYDINYDVADLKEKEIRHDVMAHIHAYGEQCPNARGIIHLGATSCYVTDNADIIIMKDALNLIKKKLVNVMNQLAVFADQYKSLPTLSFTHLQSAQPTTVGKRATLWLQELQHDYEDLEYVINSLKLLGSKGTTGTQASFMELFDGDSKKVREIDNIIAKKLEFNSCYPVSGQTYSRKIDSRVLNVLAGIATSASKFGYDLRLLQSMKEIEEPFEKEQVGSSAMAYKRNPMRSERLCSISRTIIEDAPKSNHTAGTQFFERTLDDSAGRRLYVSEMFLKLDGVLDLYSNIVNGLVVYPKVIEKHLMAELPFMMTENILMDSVKAGGDRQEVHERIRVLSQEAARNVKELGLENNLLELISNDPAFNLTLEQLKRTMDPSKYIGRSIEQVDEYLSECIYPIIEENKDLLGKSAAIYI